MLDINIKYQLIAFIETNDLAPSTETITTLLKMYEDIGLLPTTILELDQNNGTLIQRVKLTSMNGEWSVTILLNRIEIEKNSTTPDGSSIGTIEDFCNSASEYLSRILNKYEKKANRLSFLTFSLLPEMTEVKLQEACTKLLYLPKFYVENPPFEWNYRTAANKVVSIADKTEKLNILSMFNRVQGIIGYMSSQVSFDKIQANFDINTNSENSNYRFNAGDVTEFCRISCTTHQELVDNYKQILDV